MKRLFPFEEEGRDYEPSQNEQPGHLGTEDFIPSDYQILEKAAALLRKSSVNELLACAQDSARPLKAQASPLLPNGGLGSPALPKNGVEMNALAGVDVFDSPLQSAQSKVGNAVDSSLMLGSGLDDWVDASQATDQNPSFMDALTEGSDLIPWEDGFTVADEETVPSNMNVAQTTAPSNPSQMSTVHGSKRRVPAAPQVGGELNVVMWTPGSKRHKTQVRVPRVSSGTKETGLKVVPWDPTKQGSKKKQATLPLPPKRTPQDAQRRMETSITRKSNACVRCRQQRKRCLPNPSSPEGPCLTCAAVPNPKIHSLACLRYKISECSLYRTGKARGLEFTHRWPEMQLIDITDWASPTIHNIEVLSNICPIPLKLAVRKFVPEQKKDSLTTGWIHGTTKKFKPIQPYAIVNMRRALEEMKRYILDNTYLSVDHFLKDRDALARETYEFARKHFESAEVAEERRLLGSFFQLWFAIRRTAITEHICGEETLHMKPETEDQSFPLFGKIPLPPVLIQQLDMTLTIGILRPLHKFVLDELQKVVVANRPRSWITVYLITFMMLHSCALLTEENYGNARKQGLRRRYSIPQFISELHHGANVLLSHFHYITKPCNPFKVDWRYRHRTRFADFTLDQIRFIHKTKELVGKRGTCFAENMETARYEDELFFVGQLFVENWAPRDSVIDYEDGTVNNVPLRMYHGDEADEVG